MLISDWKITMIHILGETVNATLNGKKWMEEKTGCPAMACPWSSWQPQNPGLWKILVYSHCRTTLKISYPNHYMWWACELLIYPLKILFRSWMFLVSPLSLLSINLLVFPYFRLHPTIDERIKIFSQRFLWKFYCYHWPLTPCLQNEKEWSFSIVH